MQRHTKFHWNRTIRSWDIVMKPFSKWRSSAILNFQILVFWSRDPYLNVILLLRIKFHANRTINRWYSQKTAICHFEFAKFWYFVTLPSLEPKSAVARHNFIEIGWSVADIQWWNHFQNGGRPPSWIFQNCYFRHVACVWAWFCLYVPNIASIGDIAKRRFSIWRLSVILNFNLKKYINMLPFLESKFESAHQISSKSDDSLLRYSDTRSSTDADKPARGVYRSVKVTKHSTIPYVRYSFLLCNSNFVFKTCHFSDIRLQKMLWPWNLGQRSLKVIETGR